MVKKEVIRIQKGKGVIRNEICMAHGVNYYDTAYIYHGGRSETVLGRVLSGYPRDSYYVADKFNIQANPDYRFQFQDQLARLQMDYIDFYLLHGITDLTAADYEKCGCISYFQEKKRMGKIRYFGFSFHGTPGCLRKLLEKNDWDFVQIQLNYYDWYQGTARQQYEILREHDIPVMVMEPVHGGMLAVLPEDCRQLLPDKNISPAGWALRFVMNLPVVRHIVRRGLISLPICGKCQRYDGVCGRGDKRGKKLKERCAV